MKDRVILYLAGFSAARIAGLGVMLHQAMNVEATTRNDVGHKVSVDQIRKAHGLRF